MSQTIKPPKPTRLTKNMRVALKEHASNLRLAGPQKDALKIAYSNLYPRVLKAVMARYPMADMVILERYAMTEILSQPLLRFDVGPEQRFVTRKGDEFKAPSNAYYRTILFDQRGDREAFDVWADARRAYREAKKLLLKAYTDVIWAADTYEALVAVWPEATELRDRIIERKVQNQLVLLPAEAISAIQQDVAERAADATAPIPVPRRTRLKK